MPDEQSAPNPVGAVQTSLETLATQDFVAFVIDIGQALATFDWRTSAAPGLEEGLRRAKLVFRGSGGYKELRTQLLEHLTAVEGDVGETAKRLLGKP